MQRCGSIIAEAYYAPIPLPAADELVHAIDDARSVMFIWRPRLADDTTVIDLEHVNLVLTDIGPDDEARALDSSSCAVGDAAWVASIMRAMGFNLHSCRFGATEANDVPPAQWEFLRGAMTSDSVGRRL